MQNSDIFGDFIFQNFNNNIAFLDFPASIKNANLTPVHKKYSKIIESNYRPVNTLSNISKIMKDYCICRYVTFLKKNYRIFNVVFRKV